MTERVEGPVEKLDLHEPISIAAVSTRLIQKIIISSLNVCLDGMLRTLCLIKSAVQFRKGCDKHRFVFFNAALDKDLHTLHNIFLVLHQERAVEQLETVLC